MKKFFFSHPDIILAVIAFVLLATLIGFFSWGITDVISEVYESSNPATGQSAAGFNLKGAQSLQLNTSTSQASAGAPSQPTTTSSIATGGTSTASSSIK